jgi:hypothetical protein
LAGFGQCLLYQVGHVQGHSVVDVPRHIQQLGPDVLVAVGVHAEIDAPEK